MLSVLRNLELLGALTRVGTIAGTVASHDAHLHCALGHSFLVASSRGSGKIIKELIKFSL